MKKIKLLANGVRRRIKNRKKRLTKAGLREHIEERKALGKKVRVYTNKKGETFVVERSPAHSFNLHRNSRYVEIKKTGRETPFFSCTY